MSMNRRDFLELGSAASLLTALGLPALATEAPTVGLIFPPANYPIPPDAGRLYPSGVNFIGNGLGFNGMTIESYNEAIPRAMPRAQELAAQGANLISVFGSSITFYKGAAFNQELVEKVTALTGLPATTQSNGLVDGLKHVNAKRVAVATAYTDIVTERLKIFLTEHGFDVLSTKGLGFERVPEGAATRELLVKLGEQYLPQSALLVVALRGLAGPGHGDLLLLRLPSQPRGDRRAAPGPRRRRALPSGFRFPPGGDRPVRHPARRRAA